MVLKATAIAYLVNARFFLQARLQRVGPVAMCCVWTWVGMASAADCPQWGQHHSRNMVSTETNLPETCDPAAGLNIRWTADLGKDTYSTPIVAGGCVLIGTNNERPRDPDHKGDCGVLMCFDERDGQLRWQLVVPKRGPNRFWDWPQTGLTSPCTVEGDHVYILTNRNEIACLDLAGMTNGNDGPYRDEGRHMGLRDGSTQPVNATDADILWLFDINGELGVHAHDSAHGSLLIDGQYLYVCSSNGVSDDHLSIPAPDAPSLIVVDKTTGRCVARDQERIAARTIHNNWSSPSLGEVNGRLLLFFGGGDGLCYAFEALRGSASIDRPGALKKVWWFDCDPAAPKEDIFKYQDNRQEGPVNIYGMPVFHDNRVYVAAGGDYWHGRRISWLKCIDAAGQGDITKSGEVWSYTMDQFCMATPAIQGELVFITDCRGRVHCLDIKTGKAHWVAETGGEIWDSLLVADGKVYAGNRMGKVSVFAADKQQKLLASFKLDGPIHGSPTAANRVVYIATMKRLYAIGKPR